MRIVQFTDTHLIPDIGEKFLGVDTFLTLREAVEITKSLDPLPSAIIVTGDLAESGDAATYRRFREIFELLPIAVFVVPGNHDNELAMDDVFRGSNISCADHALIGRCLCLFLDSHVKGKPHGFLSAGTLKNIEALLKAHADKPVLVSLHHPISSPCPSLGCQLQNENELLQTLKHAAHPVTVLSGHLHREVDETKGHIRLLTSPSTFAQCEHPITDQNINLNDFWATHKMDMTLRGFRVLDLLESGQFKTDVHWF